MIVEFINSRKANTLNRNQIDVIIDLALKNEDEPLIFASALDGIFCAGADIDEFLDDQAHAEQTQRMLQMVEILRRRRGVVVSIVDGYCGGGGVLFPCVSDLTVASDRASFACPEVKFGMFPGVVYSALAQKIGRNAAFGMCLNGERIDAVAAREIGLVDNLPKPFVQAEALTWVESRLDFLRYYRETRVLMEEGKTDHIPELMHQNRNADQTMGKIQSYLNSIRRR